MPCACCFQDVLCIPTTLYNSVSQPGPQEPRNSQCFCSLPAPYQTGSKNIDCLQVPKDHVRNQCCTGLVVWKVNDRSCRCICNLCLFAFSAGGLLMKGIMFWKYFVNVFQISHIFACKFMCIFAFSSMNLHSNIK